MVSDRLNNKLRQNLILIIVVLICWWLNFCRPISTPCIIGVWMMARTIIAVKLRLGLYHLLKTITTDFNYKPRNHLDLSAQCVEEIGALLDCNLCVHHNTVCIFFRVYKDCVSLNSLLVSYSTLKWYKREYENVARNPRNSFFPFMNTT
jgi:hypothetical protein